MKTVTFDDEQYKVVAIEPEDQVIFKAWLGVNRGHADHEVMRGLYRAMIAAAPPYPADVNCKEIIDSWIPCSERLPDREGYFDVFVRSPGESIYNGRQADVLYCDSRWQAALQYGQYVSHWMAIPAAPKGE